MNTELQQYIESEILPSAGVVEETGEPIITLTDMVNWIEANLHVTLPITEKNLSDYMLLDNDGIINKRRNIYINQLDFYCLDLPLLGDEHNMPHKELLAILIMPEPSVQEGTFYYCTNDEWEIIKVSK